MCPPEIFFFIPLSGELITSELLIFNFKFEISNCSGSVVIRHLYLQFADERAILSSMKGERNGFRASIPIDSSAR